MLSRLLKKTADHDDWGLKQSKIMNVIDSNALVHRLTRNIYLGVEKKRCAPLQLVGRLAQTDDSFARAGRLDHDVCGWNPSDEMNVIHSNMIKRVVPRRPATMFWRRARQALAGFHGAERGVVAIEFALVAMPFFLLLTGILVVGFMLFCSSTLDYATQKAARQIMVGTVQSGGVSSAQFRTNVLCQYLPAPMFDCSKIVVNLQTLQPSGEPTAYINFVKPNYSAIIVPSPSVQGSYCPGVGSAYEVLQVLYPMPQYLSVLASSTVDTAHGQFVLMSTATFKNEPFQGATSFPGC